MPDHSGSVFSALTNLVPAAWAQTVEASAEPYFQADKGLPRQSIRRYTGGKVPDAVLRRVLDAAVTAPSAHNRQPWRFVVVREQGVKERVADAMAARLRHERTRDGDSVEDIDGDVARSRSRICEATVLVFVFFSMEHMDRYPDGRRREAERIMAIQSTAMATYGLLMAAHEEGLGACIMCAPLFCSAIVCAELGVHPDWEAQGLVTIGWPAASRLLRGRMPLEQVVWECKAAGS